MSPFESSGTFRFPARLLHWPRAALLLTGLCALNGCHASSGRGFPFLGGGSSQAPSAANRAAPRPLPTPIRAIWVARYHYRTPEDVRTIMQNCAALGCNTVLWQVRGEGTVTYHSHYEPWAGQFNYRNPGFDPLALAVSEAHRYGLRIEAWFNTLPGWRGPNPPPRDLDPPQLYLDHPSWFVADADAEMPPLTNAYALLNPCLPEVRQYLSQLVGEILTKYDVDGIHLDYVRFAWEGTPHAIDRYPLDPRTRQFYQLETHRLPEDNAQTWRAWRANQITRLVSDIRRTVQRVRPGATLTAATWRDPRVGYYDYLQNASGWLAAGLIDAALPMTYHPDAAGVATDVGVYRRLVGQKRVVPAIGVYKLDSVAALREQLAWCTAHGGDFALFSYESFFLPGTTPARQAASADGHLLAQRQAAVREFTQR